MSNSIETRCVHGNDHKFKDNYQSLSVPIYQTAAFGHPDLGHSPERFYYTRLTNPTRMHAEETVSSLEGAAATVAFSSGMAAITAVFELFSPGDRIGVGVSGGKDSVDSGFRGHHRSSGTACRSHPRYPRGLY